MTNRRRYLASGLLLGAGIACLAIGVLRAEQNAVLEKAIRICLECIGLG